jgi:plastocyanin
VRRAGIAAVLVGAAVLAVAPAGLAAKSKPKPRVVKVGDDYFLPAKMTVSKGKTVQWKWLAENGNTHDVKLTKRPKGVKSFHSDPATSDFTYKKTLRVKGTYRIVCTFHEGMVQSITVK